MSLTIRSKGGQPLMIGGFVASGDDCCCENPQCYCPDTCSYFAELLTPASVAVKSPLVDCGSFWFSNTATASSNEWLFPGVTYLPGWTLCGGSYVPPSVVSGASGAIEVSVQFGAYFCNPSPPSDGFDYVRVNGRARVIIGCVGNGAFMGTPTAFVDFRVWAERVVFIPANYYPIPTSYAHYINGVSKELETYCQYNARRSCGPPAAVEMPPNGFKYFNTPLNISVAKTSTSFNGVSQPYGTANTYSTGSTAADTAAFVDAVANAFSATFRITSRPNCNSPVGCNCNAPLGGMYVTFGNLASKYNGVPFAFELNSSTSDFQRQITNLVQWQGPFGFYEWEEYDEDGPQDGAGNRTQAMTRQRAELYCDIVDGVNQWYVLFTSFCFKYDSDGTYTHQSYDQWVGKIDCYKACADAENFIDADEPVPMGEPYDIEYIGRTTVAGYLECEPPPRATISIRQIVTC